MICFDALSDEINTKDANKVFEASPLPGADEETVPEADAAPAQEETEPITIEKTHPQETENKIMDDNQTTPAPSRTPVKT